MSKVIQNICDVVGKAYFCRMKTEISSPFYHATAYIPKAELPMRLMIDASKRGEPYFGLFNLNNELQFAGTFSEYARIFQDTPLSEQRLETVRAVVSEIDLHFLPEEVYDAEYREIYARYLKDDGVTEAQDLACESLGTIAYFREDLQALSGIPIVRSTVQTVPLTCLLAEKIASKVALRSSEQNGIQLLLHMAAGTFTAIVLREGKLHSYEQFSAINPDEFNYYLLGILEHFQSEIDQLSAIVTGNVSDSQETAQYVERLQNYVSQVDILDPSTWFGFEIPLALDREKASLLPIYLLLPQY